MDRKIVINYIYSTLYQLIKLVLPFFLVPYTMGHLGESVLGISDFANNIVAWFIFFGLLGVDIYGKREIAKVRDDKDKLSKTFFELFSMQLINMSIALVAYLLYTTFFVTKDQLIYYIVCMVLMSFMFDISWFYSGVENFKIVSIRNMAVKIIGVALIFIFVKTPADLWKFAVINSATDFIGQLFTFPELKRYIHKVPFSIKEAYKNHLLGTFILFVPTISMTVYTTLDQTMLGAMIEDKGQVSLYKTALNFTRMFQYMITSIDLVVMPRVANAFANNSDQSEINKYINITLRFSVLLAIPAIAAMLTVSPYFFPWYLPGQYEAMIILVACVSPVILFNSVNNVFGIEYLVPTGKNSKYTISVIIGAVVSVLVNFYTIPRWQGIGACIGACIAEFTVAFVQWIFVRKEVQIDAFPTVIKSVIASAIMGVVIYNIGALLGGYNILVNGVQAICGILIYGVVLILLKEKTLTGVLNSYILKKDKNV
ncbi:MAG: polysaccharide biosynthesis C-terminal domain-containing protein [Erysipelotrichaceae bacterium]|nr:polysaccharide biosynthesis C-terminal domain-containing protein [Erysipelotrichaceae bacterium]